jgi:large subunit ribosomal protein L22
MSKPSSPRKWGAGEASAIARHIRVSPRKLGLVTQMICGMPVSKALVQLSFCRKRIAQEVRNVLQSAIANAENNHGLDVDSLVVARAEVGKSFVIKRLHTRARGRSARVEKPFSRLEVVVREQA